jgi:hypothetical protein
VIKEGDAGLDAAIATAIHIEFHADVSLRSFAVALGGSGLGHEAGSIR